jgi:hypothetical protein
MHFSFVRVGLSRSDFHRSERNKSLGPWRWVCRNRGRSHYLGHWISGLQAQEEAATAIRNTDAEGPSTIDERIVASALCS